MTVRIHFTAADLARTRVSTTLGPLAETMLAMLSLRCPCQPPARLNGWRDRATRQLTAAMKPLAAMFPPGPSGVDFWTLTGYAPTIEQGIGKLLTIPREQMAAEMQGIERRLPESAWAAAETGSGAREQLADATMATYRVLVEPYWNRMHMCLNAEQVYRAQILARGGVEQLLATLHATKTRWRPPVLELLGTQGGDIHLDGRGVALIPSFLIGDFPMVTTDLQNPGAQPRLLFPATGGLAADTRLWSATPPDSGALAALVGRNRAAVMSSIVGGCSTTDIAHRAGISLAAASQHATVLRDAGLITTHRHGRAVLHALTPLGTELLSASKPPDSSWLDALEREAPVVHAGER
jgi:DNA-binding transcriptional ArsR family regulator